MRLYKATYLIILLLVLPLTVFAQRRTNRHKVAAKPRNALFEQLLPNTAKIMFIDSIVVQKDADWLKYIPLDKENGSLSIQDGKITYENGFGNYRLFAFNDTTNRGIYSQNLMGNGFSSPQSHKELSEGIDNASYPYLAADGKTLYFSGEGKNSVGKRDIFMSVYNRDENAFYEPENYGLPFNSTANDYLLIIDDYDTLGWLVSDRYQEEDKVCIYTFEPTSFRVSLSNEDYTEDELKHLAQLKSIADTWAFGDRDKALKRLNALKERLSLKEQSESFSFIVNDNTVYHDINSFHSAEARQLCGRLIDLRKEISNKRNRLDSLRNNAKAASSEILSLEQELPQLESNAKKLEKNIRNIENQN
ncbi:MAG: hypothetical protein ACOYJG_04410 [Prevotella sp.]|jgi:hypothetical protein